MTTDANIQESSTRGQRDYYTALYNAALTISSSLELDRVLHSVVVSTTEAMQVKACGLRLLNPETGQLQMSAVHGLSSSYIAKGPVEVEHSAIDSETISGTPVYIADARTDPRFQYKDAAKTEGLVSILCVPLEVRGEAIGIMRVYTGEPRTFDQNDVQFLSVLASLAALAIENARLYDSLKNSYDGVLSALWGNNIPL
jgi:GAF domain-containing protein